MVDFYTFLTYNMGMEDDRLAITIGKNIMRLRKLVNMTQLELAERLNYSDKSVSKWEQGNGVPDIRILVQIAEIFGVTVDELLQEQTEKPIMPKKAKFVQRIIMLLCSVGLCWLVAVVLFVFLKIFGPELPHTWLCFLYAVPASAVVLVVFSALWHWKWVRILSISALVWSSLACAFCTAYVYGQNIWVVFLIGIPLQILALFFFVWRKSAGFRV